MQVTIKNLIDAVQCYQTVRALRWPPPSAGYGEWDRGRHTRPDCRALVYAQTRGNELGALPGPGDCDGPRRADHGGKC